MIRVMSTHHVCSHLHQKMNDTHAKHPRQVDFFNCCSDDVLNELVPSAKGVGELAKREARTASGPCLRQVFGRQAGANPLPVQNMFHPTTEFILFSFQRSGTNSVKGP